MKKLFFFALVLNACNLSAMQNVCIEEGDFAGITDAIPAKNDGIIKLNRILDKNLAEAYQQIQQDSNLFDKLCKAGKNNIEYTIYELLINNDKDRVLNKFTAFTCYCHLKYIADNGWGQYVKVRLE